MSYEETPDSRQITYTSGAIEGVRTYTGDLVDLEGILPEIATKDWPPGESGITRFSEALEVTTVNLVPETHRADGTNRGQLTVTYGWGRTRWRARKYKDGWREDEFFVRSGSITVVNDLNGASIRRWEFDPDTDSFLEKHTTIDVDGTAAGLIVHLITTYYDRIGWALYGNHVNEENVFDGRPGVWKYEGVTAAPTPEEAGFISRPLYDQRFEFSLNVPGWNKNQFGEVRNDSGIDFIHNYRLYPTTNFHALFPHMFRSSSFPEWTF